MGLDNGGYNYSPLALMTLAGAAAKGQAQQRAARAAAAQQGLENSQKQFGLDTDRTKVTGDLQNTYNANANTAQGQVLDYLGKIRVAAAGGQFDAAKTLLGQLGDIAKNLDPDTARAVLGYGSSLVSGGNNALTGGVDGSGGLASYAAAGGQPQPGAPPSTPPAVTPPNFTAKPITTGVGMQNATLQQAAAMGAPTAPAPQSPLLQAAAQAPPTAAPSTPPATGGPSFNSVPFKPSAAVASQTGKNWADAAASASAGNKSDADAGAVLQKTATDAYTSLAGLTNPDGSPNIAAQNNMVDQINGANPNLTLPHVKSDGSNAYKMDLGTYANIQKTFADATGARVGAYKAAAEAGQVAPNAASDRLKADREGQAAMLNASTNFKQFGLDQQKFIMDDPSLPAEITRLDTLDNNIGQANARKREAISGYREDSKGNQIALPKGDIKAITDGEDANINGWLSEKRSINRYINSRLQTRASMVPPAGIGPPGSAVKGNVRLQSVPQLPGFPSIDSTDPVAPAAAGSQFTIQQLQAEARRRGLKF